jgi:hypothetical protein
MIIWILKMEINIKDPLAKIHLNEDGIIVNQERTESTVATVTTIPADDGVEVEVQTKVEMSEEDKNVGTELKVFVHSQNFSTYYI